MNGPNILGIEVELGFMNHFVVLLQLASRHLPGA